MQIDKAKLLEWLQSQYMDENISTDRSRAYQLTKREIESGRFDFEEEGYQCPECNDVNSSVRWNAATMSKYGENIFEIQDDVSTTADATFICPNCGQEVDRSIIKEVPHDKG